MNLLFDLYTKQRGQPHDWNAKESAIMMIAHREWEENWTGQPNYLISLFE